ncbi:Hsp20/alpha crystallin family protein [Chloroflexota bacterium]|nr:Hsp20/alpha crystallin family protein [Chloroflexota bacterium]
MTNLIRRDPVSEMLSWNRAMNRMLDRFYDENDAAFPDQFNLRVPLDVIENDNEFVVKADVAGLDPDKIDITYTNNNLTIKGELSDESEKTEEEGRYHIRERHYGSFSRTISMPGTVDVENIEAETRNGVLELHLPKKEEIKPKRIAVKVNSGDKVVEGRAKDK